MQVQNLSNQTTSQNPQWEQFVKPFGFTPEQTNQFITNYVSSISNQMKRSLNRMVKVYKEMKRREQSSR